jgi:putative endonuclease
MFYVYVLRSLKDNLLYIGYTAIHPYKRLKEHNKGDTKSTNPRRPFILLYYEAHTSEEDARRREKYFKTDKGKSSLRLMIRNVLL